MSDVRPFHAPVVTGLRSWYEVLSIRFRWSLCYDFVAEIAIRLSSSVLLKE